MKIPMKKSPRHAVAAVLLAAASVFAAPVQAALVQLCGQTVCYEYDNNPLVNDGLLLFGAPRLLGNSDVLALDVDDHERARTDCGAVIDGEPTDTLEGALEPRVDTARPR